MAISVGTTYYSGLGTVYNKGGNVSSGYEVRLKYLLNSYNVTTNKYNVTSTLQMHNTSSTYNTYGNVNATKTVQGVSENISYLDSWDTSWRDMYTRTFELSANDEGKLTTTLTGSFYINSYAWSASNAALKSASVSTNVEFPTIPRASEVSCSSPYIGDVATITIDKKSSVFTSTLTYKIGSLTGTIKTKTSDKVVSFDTKPLKDQIYAQIPSDRKIQGTIYCDTYSGNTKIGNTQSTTFNLYIVESDCIPDVSMTLTTIDTTSLNLTKSSNVVIKGISSIQADIIKSAKNGASIVSIVFTCSDGQKVLNVTNPTLEKVNGNVFKVTVTDTRNLSNTYTITKTEEDKTFIDYIPLSFSSVNLGRPETTSNTINAEIKGNYYNNEFSSEVSNTLKLTFRYREQGGEWTADKETTLLQTYDITYLEEFMGGQLTFTFTGGDEGKETWTGSLPDDSKPEWIVTEYNDENHLIAKTYAYITVGATELTPTIEGNIFSFNGTLGTNFDYQKQYEFEFYAEDKLIYTSASDKPIIVTKGISIIRVGDGYVDIRGDIKQNGKTLNILTYVKVK